jgi:hypothetical protein
MTIIIIIIIIVIIIARNVAVEFIIASYAC